MYRHFGKRLFDVTLSTLALVALSPIMAVVALAVRRSLGTPVVFRQWRLGWRGQPFPIAKFRTMSDARDAAGDLLPDVERISRFGRFLRSLSMDELPELFNVIRGEMSLVGPRPERPVFVERFSAEVPDYDLRHSVPGGMTGWAQVHGWRGRTSLRKRVQYDLDYIQRWAFPLDFRILVMTVQHVVWGKTSWTSSTARPPRPEPEPETRPGPGPVC